VTTPWGAEVPRLSPSCAKVLLAKSPLHAWTQHRLGGDEKSEESDEKDQGTILDRLLLGVGPDLVIVDAPDWRTNAAKEARDAAKLAGKIPILKEKVKFQQAIVDAWKAQYVAHDIEFTGKSQVKLDWESDGVPCRGKLDHLIIGPDYALIYDIKSTSDASQAAMTRSIVSFGYDIQHAAYIEGVEANYPHLAGRVTMKLVCGEKEKRDAYAVNVLTFGGTMRELGERKWRRAKRIWGECLKTGEFPGYQGAPIEASAWQLAEEMERQGAEMTASNEPPPF
jgi:hypothetical protein